MRHLYLYYDTCSGRTDGYATLARSSSSSLSLSPSQATHQWASRGRQTRFCTSLLPIQSLRQAGNASPAPNSEHTPESP